MAEVDKFKVTTDDVLTYKVTVSSSEQLIPAPKLPEFKDFEVVSQLQSSQMSWGKDGSKTNTEYTFTIIPKTTGKLKIDPAILRIKDKSYSSEEFQIEVAQGERIPKTRIKPEFTPDLPDDEDLPQVTL
jgi:hypothetical protein